MTPMDAIAMFLDEWPDAEFGPAHIVLSDDNLEDGHIQSCLGFCRAALSLDPNDLLHPYRMGEFIEFGVYANETGFLTVPSSRVVQKECGDVSFMDTVGWYKATPRDELAATIVFLELLLTYPEAERRAWSEV